MLNKFIGKNHYRWTGDKVSYKGLHLWINKNKPKPLTCENCNQVKRLDAANVSGEYKRDINDFKWLCRKCHMIEDGRMEAFKKLPRDYSGDKNPNSKARTNKNERIYHVSL